MACASFTEKKKKLLLVSAICVGNINDLKTVDQADKRTKNRVAKKINNESCNNPMKAKVIIAPILTT